MICPCCVDGFSKQAASLHVEGQYNTVQALMTDAEVVFGRVNTLSCTFGKQVSQVIQVLVTRIPHNTARRVSGISGMLRRTYRFSIRASSCIITLSVVECRLASTCRYHPSLSHATQLLASHHTLAYSPGESALYFSLTCAAAMGWRLQAARSTVRWSTSCGSVSTTQDPAKSRIDQYLKRQIRCRT